MSNEVQYMGMVKDSPFTCQDLVELVTAYREGALIESEKTRFEEHLAECPPCALYVEQIDLTVRAAGGIPDELEGAASVQELLHIFRDWKASR